MQQVAISHKEAVKIVKSKVVKIDLAKLIELRSKDVPVSDIAKLFKCSEVAVYAQLKKFKTDPAHLKNFSRTKDQVYEFIQQEITNSITPADIEKTPFIQKLTGLAILEDKVRLIQGKSTENVSIKSITSNIARELEEITKTREALAEQL